MQTAEKRDNLVKRKGERLMENVFVCGLIGFVIGYALCYALALYNYLKQTAGALRIVESDENSEPYLFLELAKPIDEIQKDAQATFVVTSKKYHTR
jgi:hypothetical protein